jgi:hypothetical protein
MSRIWVLGALFALALPVVAHGQTARVEGLALQGDYIKDYSSIFTYPSQVSNVGNLVYGELGRVVASPGGNVNVDRSVGTVLGNLWDGRFGTWGVHLRQFTPQLGQGDAFSTPNPGDGGADPNVNTNEEIDLMWGKKSGTTSFGLRFNRSFYKERDIIPGVVTTLEFDPVLGDSGKLSRNITGIGGGVGFEMNPNTNVEISLLYQSRTFEDSRVSRHEDSPSTYMVNGRAMWQWQPNVMVTPVFRWYSFDLSTKSDTTLKDNTLSGWQAGLAGNWTLGTNDLLVLGLTFAQNRLDQQEDLFGIASANGLNPNLKATETITPQVFAALETHVNNWLTFRMGASKGAYVKQELEEQTGGAKIEVSRSSFRMNLGAGVKLGTLQLDALVNDSFPQTLGGFFSQTSNFVSFPKVTATYSF